MPTLCQVGPEEYTLTWSCGLPHPPRLNNHVLVISAKQSHPTQIMLSFLWESFAKPPSHKGLRCFLSSESSTRCCFKFQEKKKNYMDIFIPSAPLTLDIYINIGKCFSLTPALPCAILRTANPAAEGRKRDSFYTWMYFLLEYILCLIYFAFMLMCFFAFWLQRINAILPNRPLPNCPLLLNK